MQANVKYSGYTIDVNEQSDKTYVPTISGGRVAVKIRHAFKTPELAVSEAVAEIDKVLAAEQKSAAAQAEKQEATAIKSRELSKKLEREIAEKRIANLVAAKKKLAEAKAELKALEE